MLPASGETLGAPLALERAVLVACVLREALPLTDGDAVGEPLVVTTGVPLKKAVGVPLTLALALAALEGEGWLLSLALPLAAPEGVGRLEEEAQAVAEDVPLDEGAPLNVPTEEALPTLVELGPPLREERGDALSERLPVVVAVAAAVEERGADAVKLAEMEPLAVPQREDEDEALGLPEAVALVVAVDPPLGVDAREEDTLADAQ